MKTIKTLLLALLLTSCTNEVMNESINYSLDLSVNDSRDTGIYKGVFTTLDSKKRGKVYLSLGNEKATGTINILGGETIRLEAVEYFSSNPVNNLLFVSVEKDAKKQASFYFSVDQDGNNPTIQEVLFNGKESDIIIVKEKSFSRVVGVTGTYTCDACTLATTFNNVVTYIDVTNQIILLQIQVLFINETYTSNGLVTDCYINNEIGGTICIINGTTEIPSGTIQWEGNIRYFNDNTELRGNWVKTNTGTNGTFISD